MGINVWCMHEQLYMSKKTLEEKYHRGGVKRKESFRGGVKKDESLMGGVKREESLKERSQKRGVINIEGRRQQENSLLGRGGVKNEPELTTAWCSSWNFGIPLISRYHRCRMPGNWNEQNSIYYCIYLCFWNLILKFPKWKMIDGRSLDDLRLPEQSFEQIVNRKCRKKTEEFRNDDWCPGFLESSW